jgi:SOS response regulatory protein OraA/RecX
VQETARKPLIRRIIDALMEAQARRAEREVAQFLQTRAWSDETEREIERRFIRRGFSGE